MGCVIVTNDVMECHLLIFRCLQVCATIGTQSWIYRIAGTEVKSLYQPWHYRNSEYGTTQQGGYLTQFADSLSFATVHHAGHEVPAYQPEMALELFRRYLDGSLFHTGPSSSEGSSTSGSSDSAADNSTGLFPDALSGVVAIILLIVGVVGGAFGLMSYIRSRKQQAHSLLDAAEQSRI